MSVARVLLGFDYGKKRIGVAVGQELTATATPLETVHSTAAGPDWAAISRLIKTWQPGALIVGLPRNMDGTEHELADDARAFGSELHARYQLPVHWIDERLSSMEAQHMLAEQAPYPRRLAGRHKDDVDKVAAQVILQTWLAQPPLK